MNRTPYTAGSACCLEGCIILWVHHQQHVCHSAVWQVTVAAVRHTWFRDRLNFPAPTDICIGRAVVLLCSHSCCQRSCNVCHTWLPLMCFFSCCCPVPRHTYMSTSISSTCMLAEFCSPSQRPSSRPLLARPPCMPLVMWLPTCPLQQWLSA